MADELIRLQTLASAHTDNWVDALANLQTPHTTQATKGLMEVQDCAAKATQQMREAHLLSIQLRVELFLALKPLHACRLQVDIWPWLPDPVSMCRYLLRADTA